MRITLNDDEIRKALAEALRAKTACQLEIEVDDCWFDVFDENSKELEGCYQMEFSCEVE